MGNHGVYRRPRTRTNCTCLLCLRLRRLDGGREREGGGRTREDDRTGQGGAVPGDTSAARVLRVAVEQAAGLEEGGEEDQGSAGGPPGDRGALHEGGAVLQLCILHNDAPRD